MNTGTLGVATLSVKRPSDVNRLIALEIAGRAEEYEGWREWTATELEIRGRPPSLAASSDGEAHSWPPLLRFVIRPGALRVRVAPGASGASPALLHAPLRASTLAGLARLVCGRPSGITGDESGDVR